MEGNERAGGELRESEKSSGMILKLPLIIGEKPFASLFLLIKYSEFVFYSGIAISQKIYVFFKSTF